LPLPIQEPRAKHQDPNEWTEIELKHSAASSSISHSVSQQSSIIPPNELPNLCSIALNTEELFFGLQEDSSIGDLLAIHIACLYQASASILQILLEAHPEGAMTAVLGMLPVHMVASNWVIPAIPLASNPRYSNMPNGLVSVSVYSEMQELFSQGSLDLKNFDENHDEDSFKAAEKRDRLKVLVDSSPESVFAKSVHHNLRPLEYIHRIIEAVGKNKSFEEASMVYLESKEKVYHPKGTMWLRIKPRYVIHCRNM
jgi:hypothetical protein